MMVQNFDLDDGAAKVASTSPDGTTHAIDNLVKNFQNVNIHGSTNTANSSNGYEDSSSSCGSSTLFSGAQNLGNQ